MPEGFGAHTNDLSLRNVQGQLVFTLLAQLAQLHAVDLTADDGSEFLDLGLLLREQIGVSRICVLSVVIVLKRLQGRVST